MHNTLHNMHNTLHNTLKIYKPDKYENCTSDEDLVTAVFDENLQRYVLHIDEHVGGALLNSSDDAFNCCFMEILRSGSGSSADNHFNLLPCWNFTQDFIVPTHIDGMIVECRSEKNSTYILQKNGFAFVQHRYQSNRTAKFDRIRKPSVLMIGIDSVSRINLRRTMPETFAFLKRNKWYEMQGYNKMGDNTFPNLMAVMAGYNETSAKDVCKPTTVGGLDQCSLMWQHFKKAGYRTAYAEDEGFMSTFNYLKKGFEQPPVDYYLRPVILAFEHELKTYERWGLTYCLGRKHTAMYIYDYCTQFASRFSDEPIFGLFWSNSFSHNSYEEPGSMDLKILEYLQLLENSGVLQTSIVIFMSDHGMRYGSLVGLPEGFLETRLPMLFIWLPPWFRERYPEYAQSLLVNRNRLSSSFDLYMTLRHIVELGDPDADIPRAPDCPDCQTLFQPVPAERSCDQAGIIEHWCTCVPYEVVTKDTNVTIITNMIIDRMNEYLAAKNLSALCRNLTLEELDSAERKRNFDENMKDVKHTEDTYRIKLTTKPNSGSFRATVVFSHPDKRLELDVESISRLNSYASDSQCIQDKQAKKYCFCREEGTTTVVTR